MAFVSQQMVFFIEHLSAPVGAQSRVRSACDRPWLGVPPSGLSWLQLQPSSPVGLACNPTPTAVPGCIVLEPVRYDHQLYLVMICPPQLEVRVNGLAAGPVTVLSVRDQVQVDAERVLHVSTLHRPHVGPPADEDLGCECPVCRVPITADCNVYRCSNCGVALHCEGDERPLEDRLECAQASSTCPRCGLPVVMTEGFAYVPEL